jgi:hypothetical protein
MIQATVPSGLGLLFALAFQHTIADLRYRDRIPTGSAELWEAHRQEPIVDGGGLSLFAGCLILVLA